MPVFPALLLSADQMIFITAFFMLMFFKAARGRLFECDRRKKKGIRSAEYHNACHHKGELPPSFFMKFLSYVNSDFFIHSVNSLKNNKFLCAGFN